jgi:hypothetical protein
MARQTVRAKKRRSMTKRVNSVATHHAVITAVKLSGLRASISKLLEKAESARASFTVLCFYSLKL